ncbi:MAG: phenylalanine 4-monooxygenase [Chthonomonadaceae bacterium]|nr:phenylalanine 4-monooxygenase [Chthonomonadaceae bacterium]
MKTTPEPTFAPGLTTTQAPFIENARLQGQLYIEQPYDLYSEGNHRAWRGLYERMRPQWERFAHPRFLEGVESLSIPSDRVPRLDEINAFLQPRTQFVAKGVSGYIPVFLFFQSLGKRDFPTTITIRAEESLDYLPEPDIFHDIAGHVPMHTDLQFADTLVRFGQCADTAAEVCRDIEDPTLRRARFASMMRAMARFFWYTIEFGLMQTEDELKVYGSGLLSSYGEIEYAVLSPDAQRVPLQLDWVVNQGFDIDHYQPLIFVVESFSSLFEKVEMLEIWMREGRLNNVATGEPTTNPEEIDKFLGRGNE